jgi:DNA-binding NtrC family response regulator
MICWSIERTLGSAGHAVVAAQTAGEGLALFERVHPDVVFLDVRLPDADGLALLNRMKDEGGRGAAVIVMTAFDENHTAAEAARLGARAFLRKPFDFEELQDIVCQALRDQARGTPTR